jgi:hypothetical protein
MVMQQLAVYPLSFLKPVVDISLLVLSKGSYSAAVHVHGVWMDIVCACMYLCVRERLGGKLS